MEGRLDLGMSPSLVFRRNLIFFCWDQLLYGEKKMNFENIFFFTYPGVLTLFPLLENLGQFSEVLKGLLLGKVIGEEFKIPFLNALLEHAFSVSQQFTRDFQTKPRLYKRKRQSFEIH